MGGERFLTTDILICSSNFLLFYLPPFFSLLEERDRKISECHFFRRVSDPVHKLFGEHPGGFGVAPRCKIWAVWLRVASLSQIYS